MLISAAFAALFLPATPATKPKAHTLPIARAPQSAGPTAAVLAAFLLGFAGKKVEFRNHGDDRDKALTLEDQDQKVFLRLVQRDQPPIALPVEPEDLYYCGEICMVALQLNRPRLGPEDRLALLRRVGAMHAAGAGQDKD